MVDVELKREGGIAYREAVPAGEELGDPVLLIHGFPQSSYMWGPVVRAAADAGRRAVAPDLPGYGDSPADPPGTWERHVEAIERFRRALRLRTRRARAPRLGRADRPALTTGRSRRWMPLR